MTSGPEHYAEAERLLERANDSSTYDEAEGIIAQAQVHATLALAAATLATSNRRVTDADDWAAVTGS